MALRNLRSPGQCFPRIRIDRQASKPDVGGPIRSSQAFAAIDASFGIKGSFELSAQAGCLSALVIKSSASTTLLALADEAIEWRFCYRLVARTPIGEPDATTTSTNEHEESRLFAHDSDVPLAGRGVLQSKHITGTEPSRLTIGRSN